MNFKAPLIKQNWNESNLAAHWFIKIITKLGYGSDGRFTFETEQRMINSKSFKRKDFTLVIDKVPLITVELKKPGIDLSKSNLDFRHFIQAHKYAVSHYVCKNDRLIAPMGILSNGKIAYLFDGSEESPRKAFEQSVCLDLTKSDEFDVFISSLNPHNVKSDKKSVFLNIPDVVPRPYNDRKRAIGADSWLANNLKRIYTDLSKCLDKKSAFVATMTFFLTAILRDCGYIPTSDLKDCEEKKDWDGLIKLLEFHLQSDLKSYLNLNNSKKELAFEYYDNTRWLPVRLDVLPPDGLGFAYEKLLHFVKGREAKTSYYTPRWLIDDILSEVEIKKSDAILDPTCGSSSFLTASVERIFPRNKKHKHVDIKKFIEKNITGVDKDWFAVQVSKAALTAAYARYLPETPKFKAPNTNIIMTDIFELKNTKYKSKKYSKIVGNPPWGSHTQWLDKKYHQEVKSFKSFKSQACVSVLVYEEASKYLTKDGKIGLVMKHEVLDGVQHEDFIKYLTSQSGVIWDFGRDKIFNNNSQTVVCVGTNNKPGEITEIPKSDTARLNKKKFTISGKKLENLFYIHKGFQSASDPIYEMLANKFPKSKYVKTLIGASELENYTHKKGKKYFFLTDKDKLSVEELKFCKETKIEKKLRESKYRKQKGLLKKSIEWFLFNREDILYKKSKAAERGDGFKAHHGWVRFYKPERYFSAKYKIFMGRMTRGRERLSASLISDTKLITKTDVSVLVPKSTTSNLDILFSLAYLNSLVAAKVADSELKQAGGVTSAAFPKYIKDLVVPYASDEIKNIVAEVVNLIVDGDMSFVPLLDQVFSMLVNKKSESSVLSLLHSEPSLTEIFSVIEKAKRSKKKKATKKKISKKKVS